MEKYGNFILAGIEIIISISRHSSRSRRTAAGRAAGAMTRLKETLNLSREPIYIMIKMEK